MRLDELRPGAACTVVRVLGEGAVHRRLLDMGITPGVRITLKRRAAFGDPLVISLRGYVLTLRRQDAATIAIEEVRP